MLLREQLNSIYLILFFVMLLYFQCGVQRTVETKFLEQKDRQLQELATYSQHVEMLYRRFVPFVIDFTWNILNQSQLE